MASITRRGNAFTVRIRLRGQSITKTVDTYEQAVTWAAREESRVLAGETAAQIKRTPSAVTVAELFDRYAREVSPGKGGWRWERIYLHALAPAFPMQAVALDGADIAEWRDRALRAASPATVNRQLNLISTVLSHAIKEWRLPIKVNPVSTINRPRQPAARKRRVSDAERAAIIAALGWDGASEPATVRAWVAWSFCLALDTMMRRGEVLALTWEHVHLDRKHVYLPKTKNGHDRKVPLSSRAVALFGLLTPGRATQRVVRVASASTFGIYFREATAAAGCRDLHFHDSRREALTRASTRLSNVAELARASGHRKLQSLMVYFEPEVEDLADKLG